MATSELEDTAVFKSQDLSLDELAAKYFGDEVEQVDAEFGALTHCGLVRKNNEDHYSVVRRYRARDVMLTNMPADTYSQRRDEAYALAVADGIGGAAFGEVASMLALRTGWELTGKAFKWNFHLSEVEIAEIEESIKVYMHLIDRRVKEVSGVLGERGMGTTLTGALTIGMFAFIVHVGDSRAYLHRAGKLYRLTKDQTLAESMVSIGLINSVDEAAQRFRNSLISCLGGKVNELDVQMTHLSLKDDDQLLICTDGLTDMVNEIDIATILSQVKKPQELCQDLIDSALAGGGKDNVTAIVGRYRTAKCDPKAASV